MSRTIIITGANGSLGQEVVTLLSAEGHQIIALVGPGDISESFRKKTLVQTLIDLGDEKEAESRVKTMIDQYPTLDAAVLLAGGFAMGNVEATNEVLLDEQITLNFKTAWFVVKPLMAHFKKRGVGQFILISARTAIKPEDGKNSVAYAISKSMLLSLADIINADGLKTGITASVILPSILDTIPNRESMPDADYDRWVNTTDVAKTISFILSETGSTLRQPIFKIFNQA